MTKLNQIIEWQELGSAFKLYIKHYHDKEGKLNIGIIFEDATREVVTEINVPNHKVKQFLTAVNGSLLSRKYEINVEDNS